MVRRPLPLGVLCDHPGRRLQGMRFDQAVCWPRPGWLSGQGALVWVELRVWDCPVRRGHGWSEPGAGFGSSLVGDDPGLDGMASWRLQVPGVIGWMVCRGRGSGCCDACFGEAPKPVHMVCRSGPGS